MTDLSLWKILNVHNSARFGPIYFVFGSREGYLGGPNPRWHPADMLKKVQLIPTSAMGHPIHFVYSVCMTTILCFWVLYITYDSYDWIMETYFARW